MRALVFDEVGPAEDVLVCRQVPQPEPSPDEALVRVTARPIDPADLFFIAGRYRLTPTFPQIAGLEGVGVIETSDPQRGFMRGQRVAFRSPGAWASFACVPYSKLIPVPDDIDDHRACQAALNPLTALGLLDVSDVRAGDTIVLTAATSSVANITCAIARERGIRTIGVVRGTVQDDAHRCTADLVLSSNDPAYKDALRTSNPAPVALLDSVGGPLTADLMGLLAPGATIVAYGVQDGSIVPVTNATLVYRNLTWRGFGIDRWLQDYGIGKMNDLMAPIWDLMRGGRLELPVASVHDLDDFQAALASQSVLGRVGRVLFITRE